MPELCNAVLSIDTKLHEESRTMVSSTFSAPRIIDSVLVSRVVVGFSESRRKEEMRSESAAMLLGCCWITRGLFIGSFRVVLS